MPRVVGNTVGIHNYELMLDVRFQRGGGGAEGVVRSSGSGFVVRSAPSRSPIPLSV